MSYSTPTFNTFASSFTSNVWTGLGIVAGLGATVALASLAFSSFSSPSSISSTTLNSEVKSSDASERIESVIEDTSTKTPQSSVATSKPSIQRPRIQRSLMNPELTNTLIIKTEERGGEFEVGLEYSNDLGLEDPEIAGEIRQELRQLHYRHENGYSGAEWNRQSITDAAMSVGSKGGTLIPKSTKVLWQPSESVVE